jgi:hypothetical protein
LLHCWNSEVLLVTVGACSRSYRYLFVCRWRVNFWKIWKRESHDASHIVLKCCFSQDWPGHFCVYGRVSQLDKPNTISRNEGSHHGSHVTIMLALWNRILSWGPSRRWFSRFPDGFSYTQTFGRSGKVLKWPTYIKMPWSTIKLVKTIPYIIYSEGT